MKVCIDIFALTHLPNTGLYSYAYEAVNSLLSYYPQPHYSLITNNDGTAAPFDERKGISIDYLDINRKGNDFGLIANFLENNKIRLYHSLNNGFSIPGKKVCKYVVTIQDVLPLVNKELVDYKYFKKYMQLVPIAIEKSDKVIAVSDYVKKQLIRSFNVSEEKIEVIYPIVSKKFKPIWALHYKNFLAKQYNLSGDFLLNVGSIHPRKNLKLAIAAFKELVNVNSTLKLVIIGEIEGKRNKHYLELKSITETLGIENNVIFLGSVNQADLPYFYNAAKCFINLSKYEGYPTTSVEAMKCQTPVLCNNGSSLGEVLGTYPTYMSNENSAEIAETLLTMINANKEKPLLFGAKAESNENHDSIQKLIRIYENLLYSW